MTICQKCDTQASFGLPNTTKPLFCLEHKKYFHVNVVSKICIVHDCNIAASYGIIGSTKREFCAKHGRLMGSNYGPLTFKKCCKEILCNKPAVFGKLEDRIPLYCKIHAAEKLYDNYVNVIIKRCIQKDCNLYAYYGDPKTKIKTKCKKHQEKNHVALHRIMMCHHPNCDTQPSYEDPNLKNVKACSDHKEDSYVRIHKSNRCQYIYGCDKRAGYALSKTTKALFCAEHCPDSTYVSKWSQTCEKCNTEASYAEEGTKNRRFCVKHKELHHVDVASKKCIECNTQANFGFPGFVKETCAEHQKKGMVFNPRKRKRSKESKCSYCDADINYDQEFCAGCKRYIDLGKTVKRHKKEETIKQLLVQNFGEETFRHDQKVEGGCSRRRPDFEISADWGIIVLEVDEHQHNRKTYSCECETTRMRQLYFDYGVEHLLFIRYNPDKYVSLDVGSDSNSTTNLKCETPKQRQEFLVKFLREQLAEKQDSEKRNHLGVVYLFYDGWSRQSVEIESLDPYIQEKTQ